jgi:LPS export ABC transporter protein LptC
MLFGTKHISKLCLPALLAAMLLLQACENDINKIQQLSASQNLGVDTVRNVEIIFSDSAHVKFRVLAPLLLKHTDKPEYNIMPKGVHLVIYDRDLSIMGNLTADTGLQRPSDNKIEFHKNVVAKNAKGDVFTSDELIWDQTTKRMHSSKAVKIVTANGDINNGIGFTSDQSFEHWTIDKMSGIYNVDEKDTEQGQIH